MRKKRRNIGSGYNLQNPDVDIEIITPHERYIEEFLEWWKKD